ncbi:MAG: hypothetical protein NTW85_09330 [Methylococcales bacterium]|nr:hypothetical protein [Methylococcales bacterium]
MLFNKLSTLIHIDTQNNANTEAFFTRFKESLAQFDKPNAFPTVNEANLIKVIDWADKQGYLQKLGIGKKTATMLAHSMVADDKKLPQVLLENPEIRHALEKTVVKKAGEKSPLTPDETKAVIELIRTGELFQDLVFTFTRVYKLSLNELGDVRKLPSAITDIVKLPAVVVSDLIHVGEFVQNLDGFIKSINSGKSPKNSGIFNNTLKTLFHIAILGDAVNTANDLFSEENQSLRIALLVYARLHNVNLEEADIDEVRNSLLNTDNPQLGDFLLYTAKNAPRLMGK